MLNDRRKKNLAYFLALSLTGFFILVKVFFQSEIGIQTPYLLLVTPVLLSAWLGGFGPGILSTFLAAFSAYYLFSQHTLQTDNIFTDLRTYLFILEGLLISLVSEARRRAEKSRGRLLESEKKARLNAEKATERSQFLAEASRILSGSIDYKTTLENVAKLLVPKLADWCIIDVLIDGKYQRLTVLHKNPRLQKFAEELKRKFPPDPMSPGGSGKVLRTGRPLIYSQILPSIAKVTTRNNPEILKIANKLGFNSFIVVPLISSRKKVLGAISFVRGTPAKNYQYEDLSLFLVIARRISLAVDNSLLFRKGQEELKRRKKVEEQLRNSRDQLNIILQNAADGITVQSGEGRLIYANDVAAKESGFATSEEMLKAKPGEITSQFLMFDERGKPINPENLPGRRAMRGEKNPEELIHYIHIKTGEDKWSIVKAKPVFNSHGKVLYAINIIHDITARKQLELQRDTFIGMASHELKTPVTTIKAYTQLLNKTANKPKSKDFLLKIDDQLNKITRIINDLMDIAKMRSGQLEYKDTVFNLESLVKQVIEDFKQTEKKYTIQVNGRTKVKVQADKNRIYQVITNLLSNAVKYSPGKNKILINISENEKNVVVSITDYGIGISRESQLKIFGSFSRITSSKTKNIPGSGLGLYISAQIIKHYKGRIWVESEEGRGSTFFFSLPISSV